MSIGQIMPKSIIVVGELPKLKKFIDETSFRKI